jgi:hypothetical protein
LYRGSSPLAWNSELPRISIPRTPVNKGIRKGRCILVGCPGPVFGGQGGW